MRDAIGPQRLSPGGFHVMPTKLNGGSIRCWLGIHKEYLVEAFPAESRNPLIVGVECCRCGRARCVAGRIPNGRDAINDQPWDEARAWLEKKLGHRVYGSFVQLR